MRVKQRSPKISSSLDARPYAGVSGLAASADSAATAGTNPAGAARLNDRLSIAGSLALTYANFSQERAIANVYDPGFEDGKSELETDGIDVGFGLSALYELSGQARLGLVYNSELDPTQDGEAAVTELLHDAVCQSGGRRDSACTTRRQPE